MALVPRISGSLWKVFWLFTVVSSINTMPCGSFVQCLAKTGNSPDHSFFSSQASPAAIRASGWSKCPPGCHTSVVSAMPASASSASYCARVASPTLASAALRARSSRSPRLRYTQLPCGQRACAAYSAQPGYHSDPEQLAAPAKPASRLSAHRLNSPASEYPPMARGRFGAPSCVKKARI